MSSIDQPNHDNEDRFNPEEAAQPARGARPIGKDRRYRVTSKRRDTIDYDKYVAAMARWVIAQAEADAQAETDTERRAAETSPVQDESNEPGVTGTGGAYE